MQTAVASAEVQAAEVLTAVVTPLIEQADADGERFLAAQTKLWEASRMQGTARGFGKHRAVRTVKAATNERDAIRSVTNRQWGNVPQITGDAKTWAANVARQMADTDPRVVAQHERVDTAKQEQRQLADRQAQERRRLVRQVFGDRTPSSPRRLAAQWRKQAEMAHRDLATIEALPVTGAAQFIRDGAAKEQDRREAVLRAPAERKARAAQLHDFTRHPLRQGTTPPDRGLSLWRRPIARP